MKKVLMPLSPQECERVFNGEQTVLVRKRVPKCDTPFEVLVYQTKIRFKVRDWQENFQSIIFTPNGGVEEGNGKVIGSFVCDGIIDVYVPLSKQAAPLDKEIVERDACLSLSEIQKYAGNKMFLRGLHITKPKLFDKPKELSEFGTVCNKYENDECDDCPYLQVCVNSYPCDDSVDTWCGVDNIKPLTRPLRSFVYVEDI